MIKAIIKEKKGILTKEIIKVEVELPRQKNNEIDRGTLQKSTESTESTESSLISNQDEDEI